MHLVFISSEYPLWAPGGFGTFLQTFGRSLVAAGHAVSIVGVGDSTTEIVIEDAGVKLYRLPKKKGKLPAFLHNRKVLNSKLKQLHHEQTIDMIEAAEGGLALLRLPTIKKVIRLHGGHHFFAEAERRGINWRKGLLEKRSFAKADGFIAVSKYVKEHTAQYLSYHNKPVEVIHHPMNTETTIPETESKPDHVLFAGTVCEKKGVRELIKAFKIVREHYPEKVLDIYGRDWFYPDGRSYIAQLKKDLNSTYFDQVIFHGSVSREVLFKRYAEAAFCVFPSHMETQGLVTLEAMLLGKPVIFSEYGPGPETITHGETGLLCDVYNPKDLAQKMVWCIENTEGANKLGENAAVKVAQKYDRNVILEENLTFYKKIQTRG